MTKQGVCCDKWAQATDGSNGLPVIEALDDGTWSVNGCCGGGCFVLNDIRFCPFCGHLHTSQERAK